MITAKVKREEMRKSKDRIPDEVLEEIFPKKLKKVHAAEEIYTQLKKMILTGRFKKEERLLREEFVQVFNVSEVTVAKAFSQLKKDGLIISKGKAGSFVNL